MNTPTTADIRNVIKAAATFVTNSGLDINPDDILRGFDAWLREHDGSLKADAWDEGHNAGYPRVPRPAINPYR